MQLVFFFSSFLYVYFTLCTLFSYFLNLFTRSKFPPPSLSIPVPSHVYCQSFLISKLHSHLRCSFLSSSVNSEDTE